MPNTPSKRIPSVRQTPARVAVVSSVLALVLAGGACVSSPEGTAGGTGGSAPQGTGGSLATGGGGAPVTASGGATGTGNAPESTGGAPAPGTGGLLGSGGTTTGTGGGIGPGMGTGTGGMTQLGTGGLPGAGGGRPPQGSGGGPPPIGGSSGTGAGGTSTASFGIGGPSRCDTAGVQLCESFENGLSASIWTTNQSGDATAVVDTMQAARGSKALHVKTTAGNGHAYVTEKMTFPAPANTLYARMFVYLGDPLTTNGHFSLAEGDGTGSSGARFGGQNKFLGVGTDGASGDWTDKDNKLIPAQTWMCFELELNGATNDFHGWWDDVERTALHRGAMQHSGFVMPQLNALWFGWYMYNATEPQDLWIDEIAIDSKPIGCAK